MTDRLLSTAEAATLLGISRPTLSRYVKAGLLRPADRTLGGHMRFDADDLRRQYAEAQRRLAEAEG